MSESNIFKDDGKQRTINPSRSDKLKEIDALYRAQIKQIYTESKDKIERQEIDPKKSVQEIDKRQSNIKKQYLLSSQNSPPQRQLQSNKSASTLNIPQTISNSKFLSPGLEGDEKVRASTFLKGQSTRTIQILRRENETKELKIRQLSNKCQNLIQKLKKHLAPQEFETEVQKIKEFSDSKMQRLQNLFKIKHEEIFFKIKLQIIALLQEFSIPKEDLAQINQIATQTNLFAYMARKLKNRLKDFRSKEQSSNFQIQKDKILSQNQQQRIHYLTQTNELLKLSESKLKSKIDDLKAQLNQYLQKLKMREQQNEQGQNQLFRLRKQNEQIQSVNQKLSTSVKSVNGQKVQERRVWQAKQKQMKMLLNNYFIDKKKLETQLEQRDGQIQEYLIKQKFLQQENERINRQLVRWKQRYEWLQRQKDLKLKQLQQQKYNLSADFQDYKLEHNQGLTMAHRSQIDEAIRKVQQYQRAYHSVLLQLQQQKRLLLRSQDQNEQRMQKMQREWLQRVKRLQRTKQEEIYQMGQDCESRVGELRQQFQKKEKLLAEEMQARMKALLAEKDKKATQQLIQLQTENDQLRRQIDDLNKIIEVKESLINVINNKKLGT